MNNLNDNEINMLIIFLEYVLENQEDSGCNDLILPVTNHTLAFLESFNSIVDESKRLEIIDNQIVGLDLYVTQYFIHKLKNIN